MLTLDEVKNLPIGKGIRITNPKNGQSYNALVTAPMTSQDKEKGLRLITEAGHLSRPTFQNYGQSWAVEKVN